MEVKVRNLTMVYNDAGTDVPVFHDLTFNVASGTSLAIIGESGVGKTTLLYLLGGLEVPTSGDVVYGTTSYADLRKQGVDLASFRSRHIGIVFQFHQLLPEFNALENVAMPLRIQGKTKAESEQRAKELLERVGLTARMTHRPGALSGGEQQRVAVARALAPEPGVILADEPTGNLDQRNGQQIIDLLTQMQEEEGVTLVTVTHSRELAAAMGQVVELRPDRLIETTV